MPSTGAGSSQLRRARLGVLVAVPVALVAMPFGGWTATRAALVFGGVATAVQLLAARLARRTGRPATPDHLVVYGIGMALRVAGVGLIWMAVTIDRAAFPPGAAALGYLGTLLPLLWLETRLT